MKKSCGSGNPRRPTSRESLKVVRACVEQRLVGTSSIGGSDLKRRMVHLLSTGLPRRLGVLEFTLIIGFVAGFVHLLRRAQALMNRDAYAAWSTPDQPGTLWAENPG